MVRVRGSHHGRARYVCSRSPQPGGTGRHAARTPARLSADRGRVPGIAGLSHCRKLRAVDGLGLIEIEMDLMVAGHNDAAPRLVRHHCAGAPTDALLALGQGVGSAEVGDDGLGFHVAVEHRVAHFAAPAGFFVAAEGQGGVEDVPGVDPDGAGA